MQVKYELSACADCLFLVANGELPEDRDDLQEDIMAHLGAEDCANLCCGDSDKDDEFSYLGCECCGSTLGGSRHQLIVMTCD